MLIDLHSHTNEYSACSAMSPEGLLTSAIEKGLDGVAITEHNFMRNHDDMETLRRKFPQIKIFNAIEVSIKEDEHVLVYGVTNPNLFYSGMSVKELGNVANQEGGIMVLAHPFRYKDTVSEKVIESDIEGLEFASANVKGYMLKGFDFLLKNKRLIKVAGSDAHSLDTVGLFATRFKNKINNEKELAKAIRSNDLSIYKDENAVRQRNQIRVKKIPEVLNFLNAGLEPKEIKEKIGGVFTFSDIKAIRENKNVLYDLSPPTDC
ncbi:MAG: PHP domain-containing protein [Firmicutes bacterium]|nr:PHP domain-containing protein [Bacillota bacterium]